MKLQDLLDVADIKQLLQDQYVDCVTDGVSARMKGVDWRQCPYTEGNSARCWLGGWVMQIHRDSRAALNSGQIELAGRLILKARQVVIPK